jgi:hypothetical protein
MWSALFWDVTHPIVVIVCRRFRTKLSPPRNVRKELPLYAAWYRKTAHDSSASWRESEITESAVIISVTFIGIDSRLTTLQEQQKLKKNCCFLRCNDAWPGVIVTSRNTVMFAVILIWSHVGCMCRGNSMTFERNVYSKEGGLTFKTPTLTHAQKTPLEI